MDFPATVRVHVANTVHQEAALHWWADVSVDSSCTNLQRNIADDQLFDSSADVARHVTMFAEGLSSPLYGGIPLMKVKRVIEDTEAMICAGPLTATPPGLLCRLMTALNAFQYLTNPAARPSLPKDPGTGLYDPGALRAWASDLKEEPSYRSKLDQNREIRGEIPIAFWAPEEDINSLGARPSPDRLRQFLGLDPIPDTEAQILLQLPAKRAPKMTVPTGWDAFNHPHFFPQPPGSDFGKTLDLFYGTGPAGRRPGAREVITPKVPVRDTMPAKIVGSA